MRNLSNALRCVTENKEKTPKAGPKTFKPCKVVMRYRNKEALNTAGILFTQPMDRYVHVTTMVTMFMAADYPIRAE